MHQYNLIVSVLSGQGESLSSVTPDNLRIPRKNKGKKTPENSVIRKEPIVYKANPRKRAKQYNVTDVEKYSLNKTPPSF